MSYCRFGSPCRQDFEHAANDACDPCPGSSLYLYDDGAGIVCCWCLLEDGPDFKGTPAEVADHLERHLAAGHHIRPSVVEYFRGKRDAA